MSEQAPRPGQATLAGWLIIGGSVVLVLTAWERISGLGSTETQEELRRTLGQPPFDGMGLSVSSLQTTVKVLCMVAAGAATASAILGVEVLRRSRQARLALSVLAPLVLVGGFATAGLFGPIVVVGVAMLWLQPTRNWFAGLPLPEARPAPRGFDRRGGDRSGSEPTPPGVPDASTPPESRPTAPEAPAPTAPTAPPAPTAPTGTAPEPTVPGAPTDQRPGPYAGFGGPVPSPYDVPRGGAASRAGRRPAALIWACVVTWASTALVAAGTALTTLAVAVMRDELFAEIERQQPGSLSELGLTQDDVVTATYVMAAIVVPWCVAAAVLAVLAIRGVGWARIALVVSSVASGVLMLALTVANPVLILFSAAAIAASVLLLRREVAAWFRR